MGVRVIGLMLLIALTSWASAQTGPRQGGSVPAGGVLSSGELPDLDAFDEQGNPVKLRELCAGQYTVLVAGCLTCPKFHQSYPAIEAASADYATKGVQFFYFYKSLRHPELGGYVEPQNMDERLLHVAEAKEKLGTRVPWLADTLDDSMRIGLKSGSLSVYVVSPEGEIVFGSDEIDEAGLRTALAEVVGPVDEPTSGDDLGLPRVQRAPRLVNEDSEWGVERPLTMTILSITPTSLDQTYYVKLRAEADQDLMRTGSGRLFLGFYPDPIHEAKWNNLTPAMKYVLETGEGVTATPAEATAAVGEGDTDTQPRQFWVDIESDGEPGEATLTLHYYGCTPTFCTAMTHEYTIRFEAEDRAAKTYGFRRGRGERQNGERGEREPRRQR